MFVDAEVVVDAGFEAACHRLAGLARDGGLLDVSSDAHAAWVRGLARVGPAPGLSRLVEVRVRDLAIRGEVAVMVLRWEAAGPGGGLFPELDADITLSRYRSSQTLVALTGAYRPPLGAVGVALDRAVLRRVAQATIRQFVRRLGDVLADSERAAVQDQGSGPDVALEAGTGHAPPLPGQGAANPQPREGGP